LTIQEIDRRIAEIRRGIKIWRTHPRLLRLRLLDLIPLYREKYPNLILVDVSGDNEEVSAALMRKKVVTPQNIHRADQSDPNAIPALFVSGKSAGNFKWITCKMS